MEAEGKQFFSPILLANYNVFIATRHRVCIGKVIWSEHWFPFNPEILKLWYKQHYFLMEKWELQRDLWAEEQLEKEDTKISWRDCDSWRDGERGRAGWAGSHGAQRGLGCRYCRLCHTALFPLIAESAQGGQGIPQVVLWPCPVSFPLEGIVKTMNICLSWVLL